MALLLGRLGRFGARLSLPIRLTFCRILSHPTGTSSSGSDDSARLARVAAAILSNMNGSYPPIIGGEVSIHCLDTSVSFRCARDFIWRHVFSNNFSAQTPVFFLLWVAPLDDQKAHPYILVLDFPDAHGILVSLFLLRVCIVPPEPKGSSFRTKLLVLPQSYLR